MGLGVIFNSQYFDIESMLFKFKSRFQEARQAFRPLPKLQSPHIPLFYFFESIKKGVFF